MVKLYKLADKTINSKLNVVIINKKEIIKMNREINKDKHKINFVFDLEEVI